MIYRKLGQSAIEVSAITFGSWAIGGWMWGGTDEHDAIKAIQKAFDRGVTTVDTAPVYGFGLSEELVGKAIEGHRHEFQILTKFGLVWDSKDGKFYFESANDQGGNINIHKYAGKESVIAECEQSLRRLKTDYIDLYQIHWADETTPIAETFEAVEQLIQEGKVRAAGVCNYTADQMKEADNTVNIATNQVPYSMVQRDIEKDVMPYCEETGKGILAYSPLQRGLLTGKITEDYPFNEGDHRPKTPHFQKGNIKRVNAFLEKIKPIAEEHGVTLAQAVINWTLQQPAMAAVLVGARNEKQAEENAKAADFLLSADEVQTINHALAQVMIDR